MNSGPTLKRKKIKISQCSWTEKTLLEKNTHKHLISYFEMSLLNICGFALVPLNIDSIMVVEPVFHLDRSPLNSCALTKVLFILFTLDVSQSKSRLNLLANSKVDSIFFTLPIDHLEMSMLKTLAP